MRSRPYLPWWSPLAPLALAAAYLGLRYGQIPETWASHFAQGGAPNGWSHRSPGAVFGPLGFAVPLMLVFELVAAAVRSTTKPGRERLTTATVTLLRLVGTGVAAMIAVVASVLPFGQVGGSSLVWLVGLPIFGALAGLVGVSRAMSDLRASGAVPGLKGRGAFVVYNDPKDPRLWVPKVMGVGWMINYGHPLAWPVTLLLAGFVALLVRLTACNPALR